MKGIKKKNKKDIQLIYFVLMYLVIKKAENDKKININLLKI